MTVATGLTNLVTVPFPYLAKAHVHVYHNGAEIAQATLVWLSSSSVQLPFTPLAGEYILVLRATPSVNPLVVFQAGSLSHVDLNTEALQLLYVIQEAQDGALTIAADHLEWDAKGRRIINLGDPIGNSDAVNLQSSVSTDGAGQYTSRNKRITNLQTPTAPADAATKAYVDALKLGTGTGDYSTVLVKPDGHSNSVALSTLMRNVAVDPQAFGCAGDGIVDDTANLQAALTFAGLTRSTVRLGPGKKYLIGTSANLTIPDHTTIDGGQVMQDYEEGAGWGNSPAIIIDPAHSIIATAAGASIKRCLVYRKGWVFPAADASLYTGKAIIGGSDFTGEDLVVIGFDCCIDCLGALRVNINRVRCDGAGVTTPVMRFGGSNGDEGTIRHVKIQPMGTGNVNPGGLRPNGTGLQFLDDDGEYCEDIIVQNFGVANIHLKNTSAVRFTDLFSDFWAAGGLPRGGSIGVLMDTVNDIWIGHLDCDGTQYGCVITSLVAIQDGAVVIDELHLNFLGQDGLIVGGTAQSGGTVEIGSLRTNPAASPCVGRWAVNYADTGSHTTLILGDLFLKNVLGSPYIFLAATALYGLQVKLTGSIDTDLAAGSENLIGPFSALAEFSLASAATLNLIPGVYEYLITGTTPITHIAGMVPGKDYYFRFGGILTFTNGSNLSLAGGANFVTALDSRIMGHALINAGGSGITFYESARVSP